MERFLVQTRHPDTDIDALVQRYVDRLETMIGLQDQGFMIKKYLRVLGVARDWRLDLAIMGVLKHNPDVKTAEDVTAAFANKLVGKFRTASPEVRFQGYLNRENSILAKKGQAELIPAIEALKTIRFVKKQLQAAQAAEAESESPANDT